MTPRRSLKLPIMLAVVMIGLLAVLTVGWILMTGLGEMDERGLRSIFLLIGTSFIGLLLFGVAIYLSLTIKAINLAQRQSNFIDSVTHELKSPIASMKLYLQTLRRRPVPKERQNGFYELMLKDLDRLDHLIDHMLDAGRLESVSAIEEAEEVFLHEVVKECAEITWRRHGSSPEIFTLDLEPCIVHAPHTQLMVLLRNLLDNALKYAGQPPRVEVRVRLDEKGRAIVRVADNGPGIPVRMRRKIFGRFVRLGSELERHQPGTGLGLFIVRKIADRLQARIRVRDTEEGTGTVFELELRGERAPVETTPVVTGAGVGGSDGVDG
jgi:two-component system phosphate regulon sensor histidine kinase PhoR